MTRPTDEVGTAAWSMRTGGHLTGAETRSLLVPLVRAHALLAAGRLTMLAGRPSGRRRRVDPDDLGPPRTILSRVALAHATARLTPALLHHSQRTYVFAAALGVVRGVAVDRELLYAAALLHDVGLARPPDGDREFTLAGVAVVEQVAEDLGLAGAATEVISSAITLHHSPRVSLDHGPVAHLLAAGAGVDVVGLHSWQLPPAVLAEAVRRFPRLDFKREFGAAVRGEAARVTDGRVRFLHRYGAFGPAIRFAPFAS